MELVRPLALIQLYTRCKAVYQKITANPHWDLLLGAKSASFLALPPVNHSKNETVHALVEEEAL